MEEELRNSRDGLGLEVRGEQEPALNNQKLQEFAFGTSHDLSDPLRKIQSESSEAEECNTPKDWKWISKPFFSESAGLRTGATVLNLVAAAFLTFCSNAHFWKALVTRLGPNQDAFLLATGLAMLLVFNLLLSFVSFSPVHKSVIVALFVTTAVAGYFMGAYGIVIDQKILTDVLETDLSEASEQLTWPLFRHILLMGVLPSTLLALVRVTYRPWRREMMMRSGVILASAALLSTLVFAEFKEFSLFGRSNMELRMYINPSYPLYSLIKTVRSRMEISSEPPRVVAADAKRTGKVNRSAVVLVLGESARAEEFSLNGYPRATNNQLGSRGVLSFTDVHSSGTDTAESLPQMFSHLGRSKFGHGDAKRYENVLDMLQRAGVGVVWRDNNSGSKGVADRVPFEDLSNGKDQALCSGGECFDEILLRKMERILGDNMREMLVVLHQKGSHGPSYYKRSPKEFKRFLPECGQDDVQNCDRQSIINAYDNTIVYADYLLGKVIDLLNMQDYPTAMLYVSDHGESLGENGIYLHGLPYSIAPRQQTHVPMIFWASETYLREKAIDMDMMKRQQHRSLSHDSLFHTLLGLFNITTAIYKPELDLFQSARVIPPVCTAPISSFSGRPG